ncbi:MAG: hypothetical protein AAGA46_03540 [Cyanobacteria bacterium P01_F01_bin.13]
MTTQTLKTLPIPQPFLDQWQLPDGWEKHITIQVAGGDRVRGNSETIALAYRIYQDDPRAITARSEWMFSVLTEWIPVRLVTTTTTALTQLTLEGFKEVLEFLLFDEEMSQPLTEEEHATLDEHLDKIYAQERASP